LGKYGWVINGLKKKKREGGGGEGAGGESKKKVIVSNSILWDLKIKGKGGAKGLKGMKVIGRKITYKGFAVAHKSMANVFGLFSRRNAPTKGKDGGGRKKGEGGGKGFLERGVGSLRCGQKNEHTNENNKKPTHGKSR